MKTTHIQGALWPRIVATIALCLAPAACNDRSKEAGDPAPVSGEARAGTAGRRDYRPVQDQRIKSQNIKTH
jgi:hypothetical protein